MIVASLNKTAGGKFSDGVVTFPQDFQVETGSWRMLGFVFFGLFGLLLIFGVIVECTSLFNNEFGQELDSDPAKNKSTIGKVFISFSPARNYRKAFSTNYNPKDNLRILNGIRFFSFLLVIFGHSYQNILLNPMENILNIQDFLQPLWFQIVPGTYFAVDTFFFISAFLGSYLLAKKFEKTTSLSNLLSIPKIYLHRYLRLMPTVFFVMMLAMTFYQYLGSGPLWESYSPFWTSDCYKYFWTNLIFINSVYPGYKSQCLGWLWYLSHDFIFFLILPLQILTYVNKRFIGYSLAALLLLGNIIVVFATVMKYDISVSMKNDSNYVEHIYFSPW